MFCRKSAAKQNNKIKEYFGRFAQGPKKRFFSRSDPSFFLHAKR